MWPETILIFNHMNNSPKFVFYYLLSLVALIFTAIATGQIIFQVINQSLPDIFGQYGADFSSGVLKFAISAIIIAAPIFLIISKLIYRSIFKGEIKKDSQVRKWLSYFILFVSAVVIIVFLIITINNFLDGEWTGKFLLKMLTIIGIAAMVFSFYLYNIKQAETLAKKDVVLRIYFIISIIIIAVAFVTALFFTESPKVARDRRIDDKIISNFSMIENGVNMYYSNHKQLPESLSILNISESIIDPSTRAVFAYKIIDTTSYQLCADFKTDTKNSKDIAYQYLTDNQKHSNGYQCLDYKVYAPEAVMIK